MTQSLLGGRRGHTAQSNMCAWTVSRCTAPPSPAAVRTRHRASTAQVEGACCCPGETSVLPLALFQGVLVDGSQNRAAVRAKDRIGAPKRQGGLGQLRGDG